MTIDDLFVDELVAVRDAVFSLHVVEEMPPPVDDWHVGAINHGIVVSNSATATATASSGCHLSRTAA